MVKKELAATANCSVVGLSAREADSIQTVEIEIHCDASVFDDHLLKCPALLLAFGSLLVAPKALGALAGGEAKSRNNGSARPVSVNFDIVVESSGCGECG